MAIEKETIQDQPEHPGGNWFLLAILSAKEKKEKFSFKLSWPGPTIEMVPIIARPTYSPLGKGKGRRKRKEDTEGECHRRRES